MPGVFSDTALWQLCPCKVSAGRRPVDVVETLDPGHLRWSERSVPIHIYICTYFHRKTCGFLALNSYMG